MRKIICPYCGNGKRFREWMVVHHTNYFVQNENGEVLKEMTKERQSDEYDAIIFCESCEKELSGELYHQFLNNYTETLFAVD